LNLTLDQLTARIKIIKMSQQQQQASSGGGSQTQSYTFAAEPRAVNAKSRPKYRSDQQQHQEHKDQQLSVFCNSLSISYFELI
jgi:hypothetical protein